MKFFASMDTSKATGTDMIGPRLLKHAAPFIADEVTFICNHSINNSFFPSRWKEAKVTPLHKDGPHEEVNNYRPISILPVMSKILENMYMTVLQIFCIISNYYIKRSQGLELNTHVKQLL